MVLPLKRWKSRSSPGFAAGVRGKIEGTHSLCRKSRRSRRLRKAERPPELMRGKPSERMLAPALEAKPVGAGWSSPVARHAHNLKVVGSNPTPATNANH